jgi:hypothetical protein
MPDVEKSVFDVFTEGIEARNRGDALEDNPYPVATRSHALWIEGWRMSEVLREDPPAEVDIFEHLTQRTKLH